MANRPLDLTPKKQKPVLWSDYDPTAYDPDVWDQRSLDPSRIPGYSEIIQANDIEKVDDFLFQQRQREFGIGSDRFWNKEKAYRMIGAHPQGLPVNFAWLPISNAAGGALSPDQARLLDHYTNREGYRLVKAKDADDFRNQFGYGFPPTARIEADGSIRRGSDLALYARPGEVARKWEQKRAADAADDEAPVLPDTLSAGAEATETFMSEQLEGSVEYSNHR